jgi:uncharacterized LabA/DUF88 family protein
VTKQNTHSEHSDVDTSVVEHSPVSETNPSSSSSGTAEPVAEVVETSPAAPVADTEIPSGEQETQQPLQEEEQEVRPFTDFIEEFRQAEARFNSSLQAYQSEALPLVDMEDVPVETGHTQSRESRVDDVVAPFVASPESPISGEAKAPGEGPVAGTDTATSAERPVSPLLRPASRLRLPRHGSGRHREEQTAERASTPEAEGPKEAAREAQIEPAVAEPTPVQEQPRPARRYRFDRPAPSTTNAPPAPALTTTPAPPSQVQAYSEDVSNRGATPVPSVSIQTDNVSVINGQTGAKEAQTPPQTKQKVSGAQSSEQGASKQPAVQETPAGESSTSTVPVTTPAQEHDRRRRDRQRGKEQSTSAPTVSAVSVVEVVPTTAEPVLSQQKEEVNPEDLPPLEYSELQKASSRRRRRRHTGSSVPASTTPMAAKATTPEVPSAAQTPLVVPHTPANTVAPANQYTITSGYTMSQMNQGHDGSSPFMGPDPSPARGTTAAQHVRAIRTDIQRTPAYPVRTTEATSASVHQLASIVSQAIQTQTDRMVAELRHANQAPTNISVSMPPFPSNERVGVFVDVANLLYSARTQRMTIDFGKLLDFLRGNRRLIRAHAYCPTSPQPGDEQMFLQAVKGLGYRITTKNYKTFSSGAKKADLDLDLCMDVVRLVDGKAVDCIVLVSGDSDFMPMLDYCSDHGVRVEVAAFDEAMSATLRQSCDLFINLSMLEEIRV